MPNIGFPDAVTVNVSRTDYAEMIAFVTDLRQWMAFAKSCLEGQK